MEYKVMKGGKVAVTETVTTEVSQEELEERLRFWTDELERLERDYAAQKAKATEERDRVQEMLDAMKGVLS